MRAGGEIRKQFPEGLALEFAPEIPQCVDDRRRGHVDDALLGTEPAELGVTGQVLQESAGSRGECGHLLTHDEIAQRFDGGDDDVVAASDGEGEAVALDPIAPIRRDYDVGRRVIWIFVHGVGAGQ